MSRIVRLGKRRAVGEGETAEDFLRLEFRTSDGALDLEPSTYALAGPPQLDQAHAEHAASFLRDPPRGGAHFDVTALASATPRVPRRPGRFAFTHGAHHVLAFPDRDALMAFVAALHADLVARKQATTREGMQAYVRSRIAAEDPEWLAFRGGLDLKCAWRRLCGD